MLGTAAGTMARVLWDCRVQASVLLMARAQFLQSHTSESWGLKKTEMQCCFAMLVNRASA